MQVRPYTSWHYVARVLAAEVAVRGQHRLLPQDRAEQVVSAVLQETQVGARYSYGTLANS